MSETGTGEESSLWADELEELDQRIRLSHQMGGVEKVARQHEFNKLTIRERIAAIADPQSFNEIGALAGVGTYDHEGRLTAFTPSNFVFGTAQIGGRPVVLSGDDFTVRGGSADASIAGKRTMAEDMALELKLPHVRLVDGMGGGGSVKTIETAGRTYIPQLRGWETVVKHLGVAPSVSLALGSVAGMGAARVTTSHYSVIVRGSAQMMIAGPALVDWASLGDVTKEELGHADIHTRNGSIDDAVDTEEEAFQRARQFLSYLPGHVDELPPVLDTGDDPARIDPALDSVVPKDPRKVYRMHPVIESVVDRLSFFETGRNWGKSVITGLARLDGVPVAIFAENPRVYGGAWTADSCKKLIRLLDLASTFHLPVIHLADCPGFLIGKRSEHEGTIRMGSQALAALGQLTTPFCCVVIRKAFGVAGAANNKPGALNMRMAWPSGDWGSLPIEGGIEVAYKAELAQADDPEGHLRDIKSRLNRLRSPYRSAEYFEIEDIIRPRETRTHLCRWIRLAQRTLKPGSFTHGYRP